MADWVQPSPFSVHTAVGDVTRAKADVLVLKFAGRLHGADLAVAESLGIAENLHLSRGEHRFLPVGRDQVAAAEVLFLGVGDLHRFRYEEIRRFAAEALLLVARKRPRARSVATTVHGVGYGLDEREAVLSLCAGFADAGAHPEAPSELRDIYLVERDERRHRRLAEIVLSFQQAGRAFVAPRGDSTFKPLPTHHPAQPPGPSGPEAPLPGSARRGAPSSPLTRLVPAGHEGGVWPFGDAGDMLRVGAESEGKAHVFVAMPFSKTYSDEYEIGIYEPAKEIGLLCERMDEKVFTGDVLAHMKSRIDTCSLLVGVLTGRNPNVYLEVGYAWGRVKPTILAIRKGNKPPFDVQGQRLVKYESINDLRTQMRRELEGLRKAKLI